MYENIVLPVELDGDTVDQKSLDEIVHLLGLEDKLKNMPNNLSGGQQQRVAADCCGRRARQKEKSKIIRKEFKVKIAPPFIPAASLVYPMRCGTG